MDTALEITPGESFIPPQALATNATGRSIDYQVDSSGVDINTPGTYNVIYSAVDLMGRKSEIIRTVTVGSQSYQSGLPNTGYPNAPVPTEYTTPDAMIAAVEVTASTARSNLVGSQDITTGLFAPFVQTSGGLLEQVSDITTIPGIANNITTVDASNASVNKFIAGDQTHSSRAANQFRPQLTSPLVMSADESVPYAWDSLNTTTDISGDCLHHAVIVLDASHVLTFVSSQNKTKLDIAHDSSGFIRSSGNKLIITIPANVTAAQLIYIVSRQRFYRGGNDDWEYFILKVT